MLRDDEMAELVEKLEPDRWAMVFETCNSGGFLDNLPSGNSTTVLVSSGDPDNPSVDNCRETSWSATYDENGATDENETIATDQITVVHGRFAYWLNSTLRQHDLKYNPVDSDGDSNNLVSILESFNFGLNKIEDENSAFLGNTDFGGVMHPAISKPDGIAPCIFLRLPDPGRRL